MTTLAANATLNLFFAQTCTMFTRKTSEAQLILENVSLPLIIT